MSTTVRTQSQRAPRTTETEQRTPARSLYDEFWHGFHGGVTTVRPRRLVDIIFSPRRHYRTGEQGWGREKRSPIR